MGAVAKMRPPSHPPSPHGGGGGAEPEEEMEGLESPAMEGERTAPSSDYVGDDRAMMGRLIKVRARHGAPLSLVAAPAGQLSRLMSPPSLPPRNKSGFSGAVAGVFGGGTNV